MSNATISIRPTDSDDVKWALQTASTQVDRGSLADAIQWVTRAAQYADDSRRVAVHRAEKPRAPGGRADVDRREQARPAVLVTGR